jgi:hypothetical protein
MKQQITSSIPGVALAVCRQLTSLFAGEMKQDRDIVGTQAPQRILVGARLPQVQAIRVDVVHVAEFAAVHDLLELPHPRVILEQVPDHKKPSTSALRRKHTFGFGDRQGDWASVLASLKDADSQLRVGRNRRCHRDRMEAQIVQQVLEPLGEKRHETEPRIAPVPLVARRSTIELPR